MTLSEKRIIPIALVAAFAFGPHAAQAQNDYQQRQKQQQFQDWAHNNPDWTRSHSAQYQNWMKHPEYADQNRSQWENWRSGKNNNNNGKNSFQDWARKNPNWVQSHNDRYQYFLSHPQDAMRYQSEWQNWTATNNNTNNSFSDWARNHEDWVKAHSDRHQYFLAHPEDANRNRHEWENWQNPNTNVASGGGFANWIQSNTGWAQAHPDRHQYFLQHPQEADQNRHEWENWHNDQNAANIPHHEVNQNLNNSNRPLDGRRMDANQEHQQYEHNNH